MNLAPHPRLLLDSPNLARVRAADSSRLRSWCDGRLNGKVNSYNQNQYPDAPDIGAGYQGEQYVMAVLNFALMYQVSGEATYGDKAVAIMLVMSDPDGMAAPSIDSGYIVRNYGLAYGLGYDWCYDRMTAAQREQIYTSANAFLAYWEQGKAFEPNPTAGNYYAGYHCAKAMCALATYDENPAAAAQWADWRNNLFPAIVAYYATHMAGGGWPEGFGYGPLAIANMSLPVWAVRTATGEDLMSSFPYPLDCAEFVMHASWPGGRFIDDRDLLHSTGDPDRIPNAMSGSLLGVLGRMLDEWSDSRLPTFRTFAAGRGGGLEWQRVLYFDPGTAAAAPSALSYFAPGMGTVFARSGWESSDTWLSYRGAAYAGYDQAAEQLYDQGSLAIVNGAKPFVLNAWGAVVREPGGNADEERIYALVYNGNGQCANVFQTPSGSQNANGSASTKTTFREYGAYAYAKTTGLEEMYRAGVQSWTREVLYLRPGIVVVRDQCSDNASDRWLQWHVPAASVDGRAVDTGVGRIAFAYPADAAVTVKPMFPDSKPVKVQQLQVRSASNPGVWVTVFQTGAAQAVSCVDGTTVQVGDQVVTFGADGPTVNGDAPPAEDPPSDPSPSDPPEDPDPPQDDPEDPPADDPPATPPAKAASVSVTRKGRWTVAGGTAHDTEIEALEDASNLALADPGAKIVITPPGYEVVAK